MTVSRWKTWLTVTGAVLGLLAVIGWLVALSKALG